MTTGLAHQFVKHAAGACPDEASCTICDGGLLLCPVCGGAEGSLPSECPGVRMTTTQKQAVYRAETDFKGGCWVTGDGVAVVAPEPLSAPVQSPPRFEISVAQWDRATVWMREAHGHPNAVPTAIGGRFSWRFTPTSIGIAVRVECACGAVLDVSDYENW